MPSKFLRFTSTAFQMGATIWLGNLLGNWLDIKYQTTYLENTITLLAVFISMYLVISQVLKISKDNKDND
ncbi:AtpZ/AtpI family protein [Oceanihabitans sp. 2_MG-2023]|uniref:AtpZ/AtpI family protein n=1 Tax=Oceanihabitans sp. 2_MG-2023 TaxID=3062661 RepID=UPI0026E2996A|nr:AtpZ/AtpI family protein [Oceanihabitans sp. 2_MG-2023]MDO6595913.1 AtpZ/AtpI family protein [Oceanihabitans sp. 2_MG-2023]